jgi:putative ABC transport system permease protein
VNKGLLSEVVWMAFDTLRTNKMRSSLTILGVVIGITAIVGMTSLIRGFDESLRDSIRQLGPNTIIVSKISLVNLAGGAKFSELMRRPNLTVDDAKAIEKLAPSVGIVDIWLGQGIGGQTTDRVSYRGQRTPTLAVLGATEQFAAVNFVKLSIGRFFTESEVAHRRRVVVLADSPYQALFAPQGLDPIGKKVRSGAI